MKFEIKVRHTVLAWKPGWHCVGVLHVCKPCSLFVPISLQRQLLQRTDRVKGVELHPTEPW